MSSIATRGLRLAARQLSTSATVRNELLAWWALCPSSGLSVVSGVCSLSDNVLFAPLIVAEAGKCASTTGGSDYSRDVSSILGFVCSASVHLGSTDS